MAINPTKTVRKIFSLPKDLWQKVDDYRFANRIGTESEAIRRLIVRGLEFADLYRVAEDLGRLTEEIESSGKLSEDQLQSVKAAGEKFGEIIGYLAADDRAETR